MADVVSALEIQDMIRHHLRCPPNGYLGSGYGTDLPAELQRPLSGDYADRIIDKLIDDVPILSVLPSDAISLAMSPVPGSNDQVELVIMVYDTVIRAAKIEVGRL